MLSERMIKKILKADITSYTNPTEAIKEIISKTVLPDFILLDINMPQMSGWEFLDQLKEALGTTYIDSKVIILTSSVRSFDKIKSDTFECITNFANKPLEQKDVALLFDSTYERKV
jgi:CheY-like chemotaxis protein